MASYKCLVTMVRKVNHTLANRFLTATAHEKEEMEKREGHERPKAAMGGQQATRGHQHMITN